MRNLLRSIVPFISLLAGACNVTTTGDRGIVSFTPDDCGQAICSLDFELASGGSVEVTLDSSHDPSRLALVSDDPSVAMTFPLPFDRWQVLGVGKGHARLVVTDHGHDLDTTVIEVAETARYGLVVTSGPAFTSAPDGPNEEIWQIPAGSFLSFRVRPFDWAGAELMGKLNLTTEIDAPLFDALQPSSSLPEGELSFQPMAPGDYWMSVRSNSVLLDVFFEAR